MPRPHGDVPTLFAAVADAAGQPVKVTFPVTVPDSENPSWLAEMLHTVEPGPFFDATSVMDCPLKVNVRSNARGWNTAVLPSAKVRWAAFQVVAAWAFPLLTTKVPEPTDPQSNVPVRAVLAFTGEADALEAARPTIPAATAAVPATQAANRLMRRFGLLISYLPRSWSTCLPHSFASGYCSGQARREDPGTLQPNVSAVRIKGAVPHKKLTAGKGVQREAT